MYRAPPEFNRICIRAARERAYRQHMDALKRVKPSIDTRQPLCPNTIGKNYKRYEIEKQRNLAIRKNNIKLVNNLDKIIREEHYPSYPPQRPYTLQGKAQKEQMLRISKENEKIIHAVQSSRPILNRMEWQQHHVDHEYQHHKNAEYMPTLPMSEIIRMEEQAQSARRNESGMYSPHPPSQPQTHRPRPPRNDDFSFQDKPAEGLLEDDNENDFIEDDNKFSFQDKPAEGLLDSGSHEEEKIESNENHLEDHNDPENDFVEDGNHEDTPNEGISLKDVITDKVDDLIEPENEANLHLGADSVAEEDGNINEPDHPDQDSEAEPYEKFENENNEPGRTDLTNEQENMANALLDDE